jgi:hypothetical protein
MRHIPVEFEFDGALHAGVLAKISGSGDTNTYHLYVNNYYWGQLWKVNGKWKHAHPKINLDHLAEEFGKFIDG